MKYTVNSTTENVHVEEFVLLQREQDNLQTAVENMVKGTMAAMAHFAGVFGGDKEKELLYDMLQYLQMTAAQYIKTEDSIENEEEFPYEDMESEFINWVYGQGYDDPYAFADRYEGLNMQLDFTPEMDEISVYFADENGNKLEEIGTIPAYLFEDEPEMAAAMCIEYTSIAVLCLDKLYSGINNPLRNLPVGTLEKRIKERLI